MKITIRWEAGTREVEAFPCGVPGLAIYRDPEVPGCFIISHLRSGLGVCHFGDPEAALAGAHAIAAMCDWAASGAEIAARVRGLDVLDAVHDMGGGVRYAFFSDPDGNSWALQQISRQ